MAADKSQHLLKLKQQKPTKKWVLDFFIYSGFANVAGIDLIKRSSA